MQQSNSIEDANPRHLTDYRRVQIKTYALQTLTGQISKRLGTSVTSEDFDGCRRLAEDAVRQAFETQALLRGVQEHAPESQQDMVQKHNHRLMLQKLTSDLYVTARVLEHVVQTFVSSGNSAGPGDAQLDIQRLCTELADDPHGTGIDAMPVPSTAFCEDGALGQELPAECLLLREVVVRDQPSGSSSSSVRLPAGLQVTVLQVLPNALGRYEWGRINEALGYGGFIVLRDIKYGISFVRRKSQVAVEDAEQYAIGEYTLLREAAVSEELSHESRRKTVLPAGSRFSVLEVIALPEVRRIRARITGSGGMSGFVTLRYAEHTFARHLTEGSSCSGADSEADSAAGKPLDIVNMPKADIFEATQQFATNTQQFATNAISKMASELKRELGSKPSEQRQETYTSGDYVLVRKAAVNEAPEFSSKMLGVLDAGKQVSVLEVISVADEQRIRGRILMPSGQVGFISLCSADFVFARRVDATAGQASGGICLGPDDVNQPSADMGLQQGIGNAAEAVKFEAAQKFASNALSFASREFKKLPDPSKMPNLRKGLSKVADLSDAWRKNTTQDQIL
mmetsp:Transcript_49796/g.86504  ORF Transcript_49796/g.86504 Transcript_49796/m.86504 type:complete len:568 (-) Transcript_49796:58-1761(-)